MTLGIFQLLLGSVAARTQQGYDWGMGPRDEPSPISGVPARLQRAFYNYMETFPMFVAAMLAAVLLGKTGTLCLFRFTRPALSVFERLPGLLPWAVCAQSAQQY